MQFSRVTLLYLYRITLLFLLSPLTLATPAPPDAAERIDEIFAEWNSVQSPGCAVGVEVDQRRVLSRSYGMSELEHNIPITPDTIFEAGSVSKQFTAAAIQLLAMDGKLSLDDDVRKYVPEVPEYSETITLRHMLNHTSGLRDWGSVAYLSGWGRYERSHTHAHVLDIVSRQSQLNFTPGAEYSYSNTGYNLLAIIVARVSGMSFAEFSKRRIFEPLGMDNTQWRDNYRRIVAGRSAAYDTKDDGSFVIDRPIEHVYGNGGLLTTIGDLLIWNRALANERLGKPGFVERMYTQGRLTNGRQINYASGVSISPFFGVPSVTHTGATSGYRAFLGSYAGGALSIAMLCNAGNANPGDLGRKIASVYLGVADSDDSQSTQKNAAVSRRQLAALSGLYRDTFTGEPVQLSLEDGQLRINKGPKLRAISGTEFAIVYGDEHLVFDTSSGKRPRYTRFLDTYALRQYEPVDSATPTANALQELEGEYYSADAETTLTIALQNGQLLARRRPDSEFILKAVYEDGFEADGLGFVRFYRNDNSNPVELSVYGSRVYDMRFQRRANVE
ncbi:MAG: serine hydrolase domain-containing protein, partial [Woeseia sp.]